MTQDDIDRMNDEEYDDVFYKDDSFYDDDDIVDSDEYIEEEIVLTLGGRDDKEMPKRRRKKKKDVDVKKEDGNFSERKVQKFSPFDHKSSKFSGAWHGDGRYWVDKPSKDIVPARVLSKLDINPTLRYCKHVWWFELCASVENVPRGIYEACVRMGYTGRHSQAVRGEFRVHSEVYKKEDKSDLVSKHEIKYKVSNEMSRRVPSGEFVEVCLGRLVLTESITQRVGLRLFDTTGYKTEVYFESFGLRRVDKWSIAVMTLLLCLNRLSSCPGDDTSVSIASQSLYNAAPRARMLIDIFGRRAGDKNPKYVVRRLETL